MKNRYFFLILGALIAFGVFLSVVQNDDADAAGHHKRPPNGMHGLDWERAPHKF